MSDSTCCRSMCCRHQLYSGRNPIQDAVPAVSRQRRTMMVKELQSGAVRFDHFGSKHAGSQKLRLDVRQLCFPTAKWFCPKLKGEIKELRQRVLNDSEGCSRDHDSPFTVAVIARVVQAASSPAWNKETRHNIHAAERGEGGSLPIIPPSTSCGGQTKAPGTTVAVSSGAPTSECCWAAKRRALTRQEKGWRIGI